MFEVEEKDAIKINEKEAKYLGGLKVVYGDPRQSEATLHVNPTYNLVNWMRVRNLQERGLCLKDVSLDEDGDLNFRRDVSLLRGVMTLREYIERKLKEQDNMEVKGVEGLS